MKRPVILSLDNSDLPEIVNGKEGDGIADRPFDYCFTQANILKSWINVGFMPMTRKCLKSPKVRHLLGEGGSDGGEIQAKIEDVCKKYQELKAKAHAVGINSQVFNCEIPVHRPNKNLQLAE